MKVLHTTPAMPRRDPPKRSSFLFGLGPRRRQNRRLTPRPPRGGSPAAPSRAPRSRVPIARTLGDGLRYAGRCVVFVVTLFVGLALLAGAGLGGFNAYQRITGSNFFGVSTIRVLGTRRAAVEDIERQVQGLRGRNLLRVDLAEVARLVEGHAWVKQAHARRELPSTVVIEIEEHRARALLLIGHLYLVSDEGRVFKKATPEEVDGVPVITGLSRLEYLNEPRAASKKIRGALTALEQYHQVVRPPIGEVHVGELGEVTLFLRRGTALRFGARVTPERLARLDAIWTALGPDTSRARIVFLDNETRTDRIVVRMSEGL
jgi:cell division septal protein FtsQ